MKNIFLGVAALFGVANFAVAADGNVSSHIRILAASCAACHGHDGNSVGGTPVLAGLDPNYFIAQMQAFRDGSRGATVMQHHAKGLTPEETDLLANYFAAQPRKTPATPMPLGDLM